MVTIKQIAERAGVSTATVSNVIHGKTQKASAETVRRIRELIDEMGYVQEKRHQISRDCSSRLVAVIIHYHRGFENSVLADPFYGIVTGNIEKELRQRGCSMMLYTAPDVDDIFKMLMSWDVDGVIAVSCSMKDCKKIHNLIGKPMISIDSYGDDNERSPVPNVGLDDEGGGYLMVHHLLERGYEHIFMAGVSNYGIDRRRWLGARRVCGTPLFQSERKRLEFIELGSTQPEREGRYQDIARQIPFRKKTAIFFTSDSLAMEAVSYWTERDIQVPRDVGVAGFDNSIHAVNFSIPRLTTINQNMQMKARIAVEELITSLQDPAYQARSYTLPVSLVVRQSV